MSGTSNFTLTGSSTYTGSTSVTSGTLYISGGLGTSVTPSGAITVGLAAAGNTNTITLNVDGGNIYGTSLTENNGGGSGNGPSSDIFVGQGSTGGSITLTGALNVDAANGDENGLFAIYSGTVSVLSASIGRGNVNEGATAGAARHHQ